MFENLRIESLISEREAYENAFFNFKDIEKSREIDFRIHMFELDNSWDSEDYFMQLRDLALIEEYQDYNFHILEEVPEKDMLDFIIESYEETFDYPEYDYYDDYDDYFVEEISMDAAYCGNVMIGYEVKDDPFDTLDFCDYPEGPDENIGGFRYPEPVDFEYDVEYPEFEHTTNEYDEYSSQNMDSLIEDYLAAERNFMQYVMDYDEPVEVIVTCDGEEVIIN